MSRSSEPFSRRFGHRSSEAPITVRDSAPDRLRYSILQIANEKSGLSPGTLREIVCGVLRVRPDSSNWSPFPNIWNEVDGLVSGCEWFRVYDMVEAIYSYLEDAGGDNAKAGAFAAEINQCYRELGIGWHLVNGLHEARGDDAFEATVTAAKAGLAEAELSTSSAELAEAIQDLSRRPEPDVSGAVQHAMAALEAVARHCTGDSKETSVSHP